MLQEKEKNKKTKYRLVVRSDPQIAFTARLFLK